MPQYQRNASFPKFNINIKITLPQTYNACFSGGFVMEAFVLHNTKGVMKNCPLETFVRLRDTYNKIILLLPSTAPYSFNFKATQSSKPPSEKAMSQVGKFSNNYNKLKSYRSLIKHIYRMRDPSIRKIEKCCCHKQ